MKKLLTAVLAVATAGVISFAAFPRPVRQWRPEELYEKSDLVLIGVVTEVKDTGTISTIRLASNRPLPVRTLRATVRVMKVARKLKIQHSEQVGSAGRAKTDR